MHFISCEKGQEDKIKKKFNIHPWKFKWKIKAGRVRKRKMYADSAHKNELT